MLPAERPSAEGWHGSSQKAHTQSSCSPICICAIICDDLGSALPPFLHKSATLLLPLLLSFLSLHPFAFCNHHRLVHSDPWPLHGHACMSKDNPSYYVAVGVVGPMPKAGWMERVNCFLMLASTRQPRDYRAGHPITYAPYPKHCAVSRAERVALSPRLSALSIPHPPLTQFTA